MKTKKSKDKEKVTMKNICDAVDVAFDLRFPPKGNCVTGYNYPCQVTRERIVEWRRPTTWEKFVWGDCDYAPWKKKEQYTCYL